MIRVDGFNKKRPTHVEVVQELMRLYPEAKRFSEIIISRMTPEVIDTLLDTYEGVLSGNKRELIKRFLRRKVDLLQRFQ